MAQLYEEGQLCGTSATKIDGESTESPPQGPCNNKRRPLIKLVITGSTLLG